LFTGFDRISGMYVIAGPPESIRGENVLVDFVLNRNQIQPLSSGYI